MNIKAIFAAAAAGLILCSCGSTDTGAKSEKKIPAANSASVSESSESSERPDESSEPENTDSAEDPSEPETSQRTVELDLSDSENPQVLKVSLSGEMKNGAALENVYNVDLISTGVVGLFGCPVHAEFVGEKAVISFEVDEKNTDGVPLENLIVLCGNYNSQEYNEVESRLEGNTVIAEIDRSDTYMLADSYQWYSVWGVDMSEQSHDVTVKNDKFGFKFILPAGLSQSEVLSDWTCEDGRMMEMPLLHQNQSKEAEMTVTLKAMRFPNSEDECRDPQPMIGLGTMTDEILSGLSASEFIHIEVAPKESIELSDGRKGYLIKYHTPEDRNVGVHEQSCLCGYYQYSDDTYIILSYLFNGADEKLSEKADSSLRSFEYYK